MASAARLCLRPLLTRALARSCTPLASRSLTFQPVQQPLAAPSLASLPATRAMSSAPPLTLEVIHQRVMLILNLFDKIDNAKLQPTSHFIKDLGLDSLDHVEIMIAMEDEFGFQIPDDQGETLVNAEMVVRYVADHQDIYH